MNYLKPRRLLATSLLVLTQLAASLQAHGDQITLQDTVTAADNASYLKLPFDVPAGTERITVDFDYPRDQGVTIDLGIVDPDRLRGWSGGNKTRFTLSETDATPSYLPGPLPVGRWSLLLGVPHAAPEAAVEYTARIRLDKGPQAHTAGFTDKPLRDAPGWYRGDLHSHTGHSDGSCDSTGGNRVPCPAQPTLDAARERGLDFIALTEHNARSHFQVLRELQSVTDDLLLLAGQEITTFYGHANLLGTTGFMDWRLVSADATPLIEQLAETGGVLSINHPGLPSGKRCMGCGWTAAVDYNRMSAVEVVNGGTLKVTQGQVHTPVSGIPFWERRLAEGYRLTAIAGSDNHNPESDTAPPGAIGYPTTVIYAANLSQQALMDGLRSGRVYIDVTGNQGRVELSARAGDHHARMGESLTVAMDDEIELSVNVHNLPGARIKVWYRDSELSANRPATQAEESFRNTFHLKSDGKPAWLRAEVWSEDGRVALISNPVYLNFD